MTLLMTINEGHFSYCKPFDGQHIKSAAYIAHEVNYNDLKLLYELSCRTYSIGMAI